MGAKGVLGRNMMLSDPKQQTPGAKWLSSPLKDPKMGVGLRSRELGALETANTEGPLEVVKEASVISGSGPERIDVGGIQTHRCAWRDVIG